MTKYAVVTGLKCTDPGELHEMTLTQARIKACRMIIKQSKDFFETHYQIGIFKESKYHMSAGRYMPELVESIDYNHDDFYLTQWEPSKHRVYRVSPKTGKLLDINKYLKYY